MNVRSTNAIVTDVDDIALRGRGVFYLRLIDFDGEGTTVEAALREATFADQHPEGGPALASWTVPVAFDPDPATTRAILAAIKANGWTATWPLFAPYVAAGLERALRDPRIDDAVLALEAAVVALASDPEEEPVPQLRAALRALRPGG